MASLEGGQGSKEAPETSRFDNVSGDSLAVAHCFSLVVLVVLLILGGSHPRSDFEFSEELIKCLDQESWAPKAAQEFAKSLGGLTTNHNSLDGVENTWSSLVMALEKYFKDDALWLGYGTGKGQFYSAVNCAAANEMKTDYCADSNARFVVKAKSNPVFGDDFVHRYKYVEGGESGGGTFHEVSTGDGVYYPRSRPWFFFGTGAGENGTWGEYTDKLTGVRTASFGITYDEGVVAASISPEGMACFEKFAPKEMANKPVSTKGRNLLSKYVTKLTDL